MPNTESCETMLEALLNNPFTASAIINGGDLIFEYVSDQFVRLTGNTREQLLAKSAREVISMVFNAEVWNSVEEVCNAGKSWYQHEIAASADPTTSSISNYFNLLIQSVKDSDGKTGKIVMLAWDVTEEVKTWQTQLNKQVEKDLRELREQLELQSRLHKAITDSTPDLIYAFDLNARFIFANKALLKMWGRTMQDSIGKSLLEIGYEPWHAEMHEKEIEHIKETKETVRGEVAFPHATLGRRIYDYIFVPVLDAEGNITTIAGTTRDITEMRQLLRQKDEFLGIASHELKTPVTSIKAYGQVLQTIFERKKDPTSVAALQKMDSQVNKLTGLIQDLLDVTKIQAGKMLFNKETFNVSNLVTELVDELQLTTQKHTIIKKLDTTIEVFGDRERIGQVITNFITNAIKYSPLADKIEIELYMVESDIIVSVKDFGIGIPIEMQGFIFEQFYRVSASHSTIPGLGIGLYISSEIIKRIGGKIWVESEPGAGSTFYFSLPQAKEENDNS